MIGGVVVDATTLIALAERTSTRAAALVDVAVQNLRVVCVPAVALMEAWARLPEHHQAYLVMLTARPVVVVDPVDHDTAIDAGALAAAAGRPEAPPGLMQAIHVARERGWPVITADPKLAQELDSGVTVLTFD